MAYYLHFLLLSGDSKIIITTELESKPYVDLTIDMLKILSVNVEKMIIKNLLLKVIKAIKHLDYSVEGDFSQAAFWLVAGILGAD